MILITLMIPGGIPGRQSSEEGLRADGADAAMYRAKREGKDCIRIFRGEEEE
jgi:PleD family two-component response regulator